MDRNHDRLAETEGSGEVEDVYESASGRVDEKNPLLIKLKISKAGCESRRDGSPEVKDTVVRTCVFCGKEFTSGKALGGHVRIHNQEGKFKGAGASSKKLKRKVGELGLGSELGSLGKEEDDDGGGMLYRCCICDRKFPTSKSLCGHMRFHPERGWKGVQPPKRSEAGEEVNEDEDAPSSSEGCMVDLLKDLGSWSKTEKRGRISLVEAEPGAALGLMKLARMISTGLSSTDGGEGGDEVPGLREEVGEDLKISHEVEDPSKIAKKSGDRSQFECITYHKTLPSFQPSGGLRSIHNKDRGINTHPSKTSPYPDIKKEVGATVKEEQDSLCHCRGGNDEDGYETCLNKFPTGRAGWASPADEASSTCPRVILPITRTDWEVTRH
ncbi:hypothetical protein MLD38_004145 [Melastoma candidum]|uniref:Uncharacterized protein n=1 Tax=Melastoma candidum TaxID=119954 RepID=A0ACB9S495_9MYRT|nr:hypothetical protein MLD38_004145 [Melastoma candidum]